MTGLVVLLIAGVLIIWGSGSKVGRWAGGLTTVVAAVGITALVVAHGFGVVR